MLEHNLINLKEINEKDEKIKYDSEKKLLYIDKTNEKIYSVELYEDDINNTYFKDMDESEFLNLNHEIISNLTNIRIKSYRKI